MGTIALLTPFFRAINELRCLSYFQYKQGKLKLALKERYFTHGSLDLERFLCRCFDAELLPGWAVGGGCFLFTRLCLMQLCRYTSVLRSRSLCIIASLQN